MSGDEVFDQALYDVYAPKGENPNLDAINALKLAMLDMGASMEAVVGLIAHWGIGNLHRFQRAWLEMLLGEPGSNERAARGGVRLFFGYVNSDTEGVEGRVDIGDVDPNTVWAGRLASAWVVGDMDTVHALEACEALDTGQQINRAVELLRGMSWLIAREVPEATG